MARPMNAPEFEPEPRLSIGGLVAYFLVVEDDILLARTWTRVLRALGQVRIEHCVAQGLKSLESELEWTAVFVDVGLPDGSGFEIVERARLSRPSVDVLVLTGLEGTEVTNRAFDLQAEYLCKPVETDRLLAFARRSIQRCNGAKARRESLVRLWSERYELTSAETMLLHDAVAGASRSDIAFRRGVTAETVNKHAKNLLSKTGDQTLLAAVNRLLREALE